MVERDEAGKREQQALEREQEMAAKRDEALRRIRKIENRRIIGSTTASIAEQFKDHAKEITRLPSQFPNVNKDIVADLYKEIMADQTNPLPATDDDESVYQAFINKAFKIITDRLKNLHLKYIDSSSKKSFIDPVLYPDCSFVPKRIASPTWENVVILGEIKKRSESSSEGFGQVVKYATFALEKQNRDQIALFWTSVFKIQFIFMDGENSYTSEFDLFNKDSKEPTVGFIELIRLLSVPFETLGYKNIDRIRIDGIEFKLKDKIGRGTYNSIYEVDWKHAREVLNIPKESREWEDVRTAMKVRDARKPDCILEYRNERKIVELISKALPEATFLPHIFQPPQQIQTALFIRPVGISLKGFFQQQSDTETGTSRISALVNIAKSYFKIVEQLHSIRRCHGDLNPKNVIVDEKGNLVLIDWHGCIREGGGLQHTSTLAFASRKYLTSSLFDEPYTVIDEIETVVYSLYYILQEHHQPEWVRNIRFTEKIAPARDKLFESLCNNEAPEKRFIHELFQLVKSHAGDVETLFQKVYQIINKYSQC